MITSEGNTHPTEQQEQLPGYRLARGRAQWNRLGIPGGVVHYDEDVFVAPGWTWGGVPRCPFPILWKGTSIIVEGYQGAGYRVPGAVELTLGAAAAVVLDGPFYAWPVEPGPQSLVCLLHAQVRP